MSKITKSNTKDEILAALAEAKEEQDLLHNEVESLQKDVDILGVVAAERDRDNTEKITNLEFLVQEEDVKKKGLIKELAKQSADVELASKKTEKYVEIKETLKSTIQELELVKGELLSANKKVELLTTELESFKNRALPSGIKKGFGRFFNFKKMAFVSVIIFAVVVLFGSVYVTTSDSENGFVVYMNELITKVQHNIPIEGINPLASMTFITTDGVVTARHNDGTILQTKDGVIIDDSIIIKWASKAGFDGILFGTLTNLFDKVDLERTGAGAYENTEIDIERVASKFKELGCDNVLALVENEDNLNLPGIFTQTSNGKLEIFESRRMLAGFVPVFWGKEKKQMNIKSDNVYAYITSDTIFMEVKGIKASVNLEVMKEDDSSEVAGVKFGKFKQWKENIKNLW
jgi:hypothetical protein